MKNGFPTFILLGAAGYVAPCHMAAIKAVGGEKQGKGNRTMPLYDYECQNCGSRFEVIEPSDAKQPRDCCAIGSARRIISAGRCFTGNQDAAWVRSVTDVVANGEDADYADKRFLSSGKTKQDLKAWMTAKGLRHLERGEPLKPKPPDMSNAADGIMKMRRQRERIEIITR